MPPPLSISVAVCVDGDAPALDRVVAALRAQGAEPEVVRASEISTARNAALAGCASDGPRLRRRRRRGRRRVVGAPARGLGRRPPTTPARSAGRSPGPGPPSTTARPRSTSTRRSARSTRATSRSASTALAGVQGFWPARGRPRTRDWFCEEHQAQRELAAAGWRVRYEPALAATRVGPADGLRAPAALRRAAAAARRAAAAARPPPARGCAPPPARPSRSRAPTAPAPPSAGAGPRRTPAPCSARGSPAATSSRSTAWTPLRHSVPQPRPRRGAP